MLNQEVYDELVSKFEKLYGEKPQVVAYAPGRIEVLGNHTDYNEGYVFSAAIDKGTFFAVSPTADANCELTAGDFMETAKFTTSTVAPAKQMTWQNDVTGTFNWLFDGNPAAAKHGWKGMFLGNIPLGAGLSSSAALEMCTVLALSKLYGIDKEGKLFPTSVAFDKKHIARYIAARLEPGVEYPVSCQRRLFEPLQPALPFARISETGVLYPAKSMMYCVKLSAQAGGAESLHDCARCSQTDCPYRTEKQRIPR